MKYITTKNIILASLLSIIVIFIENIVLMDSDVLKNMTLTETSIQFVKDWASGGGVSDLLFITGIIYTLYYFNKNKKKEELVKNISSIILITITGAGFILYFSKADQGIAILIDSLPLILAINFLNKSYKKDIKSFF